MSIRFTEFPAVLLNTITGQIESEFHKFVRPTRFPTLSEYCKGLTGISQSLIDGQDTFPTVFAQFLNWLATITASKGLKFAKRNDLAGKNVTFCSWTSWDFKEFLAQDCRNHKLKMPAEMKVWIDIRYVFRVFSFLQKYSVHSKVKAYDFDYFRANTTYK